MKKTIIAIAISALSMTTLAQYKVVVISDNYVLESEEKKSFAKIDVSKISNDGVINSLESLSGINIKGYAGHNAKIGDDITVTLNDDINVVHSEILSGSKNSDGNFDFDFMVDSEIFLNNIYQNKFITVKISGFDENNNEYSAKTTEIYKIDLITDIDFYAENEIITNDVAELGGWVEFDSVINSIKITDGTDTITSLSISTSDDGSGYLFFEKDINISSLKNGNITITVNATDQYENTDDYSLNFTKS